MIECLRGNVLYAETDYVVLDVQGVGYQVYCVNPYRLVGLEREVTLFTHHHVREDAHNLYGFETRDELRLFRRLLDVSGIGPKVALGVLGAGTPAELLLAIQQENVTHLTRLPGIGRKTAQRMILDLKDKTLDLFGGFDGGADSIASAAGGSGAMATGGRVAGATNDLSSLHGKWMETKEALRALGYSEQELSAAWVTLKTQVSETHTIDEWLKLALQVLYRQ